MGLPVKLAFTFPLKSKHNAEQGRQAGRRAEGMRGCGRSKLNAVTPNSNHVRYPLPFLLTNFTQLQQIKKREQDSEYRGDLPRLASRLVLNKLKILNFNKNCRNMATELP